MSEWWHWLLLIAICAAVLGYIIVMYWFDSVELSRGVSWSLVLLRVLAFGGILFFFLDLEKRTEQREIKPSRAAVLVDTSQSMTIKDTTASSGDSTVPSRIEQVVAEFRSGELFKQLRERHEVAVYQFDEDSEPTQIAFFNRFASRERSAAMPRARRWNRNSRHCRPRAKRWSWRLLWRVLLCCRCCSTCSSAAARGAARQPRWPCWSPWSRLVAAFVVFAVANLRADGLSLASDCRAANNLISRPKWLRNWPTSTPARRCG